MAKSIYWSEKLVFEQAMAAVDYIRADVTFMFRYHTCTAMEMIVLHYILQRAPELDERV